MEYLIGAIVMWIVLAGLFTWYQETYNNVVELIIAFPVAMIVGFYFIITYPFYYFKKVYRKKKYGIVDPIVVYDDTPSSPEGEFRFGEERSSPFYFARAFYLPGRSSNFRPLYYITSRPSSQVFFTFRFT